MMSMEKKRFFEPWIPEKYKEGINGKKILVVGASYYCKEVKCPYFEDCTSIETKDSSKYDELCPACISANRFLHDEPLCSTGSEQIPVYSNFARLFQPYVNKVDDVWNKLAFTNYVQYFLPVNVDEFGNKTFAPTLAKNLSQRDFDAFIEVVQELKPDIVVFWGMVIEKPIRQNNNFIYDLPDCFNNTEGYVCHMRIPNVEHNIALFNCYHPSSSAWKSSFPKAAEYLKKLLAE